jgi:glutaminyl-tRNA synthetase
MIANWVVNELRAALKERALSELPFDGDALGRLVALVEDGVVNSSAGKAVLAKMIEEGGEPSDWVERLGLRQITDRASLAAIVDRVIASYPDKVAAYRGGRTGMAGFFVGQAMKETGGAASPQLVQELVAEALAG